MTALIVSYRFLYMVFLLLFFLSSTILVCIFPLLKDCLIECFKIFQVGGPFVLLIFFLLLSTSTAL